MRYLVDRLRYLRDGSAKATLHGPILLRPVPEGPDGHVLKSRRLLAKIVVFDFEVLESQLEREMDGRTVIDFQRIGVRWACK